MAVTLVLAVLVSGAASADPTVFVSPAELTVNAGDPFEMSIRVDAGYPDSVTAFLVDFTFDAGVIELLSAEEGSLFANCGYPTMFHWDSLAAGSHSCNDVTLGHTAHVFLPGELVALDFVALSVGETPISITAADLRDINRDPILPVYSADGFVTVLPETGVEGLPVSPPADREIRVFPNPSSDHVKIEFPVDRAGVALRVDVLDVAGRIVARPRCSVLGDGTGSVTWGGRSDLGAAVPSGIYLVVVRAGETTRRAKCLLLR
jgi:hypothetical protein